ncbi:preprotein translocase subunit SecA [Nonomuraea sp. H19]|uniref:preprotein translocase subunit SecA n=1 Tax=Nonomuraea sp. H19 TaxID=3452206 RepID=UPI003F8A304A
MLGETVAGPEVVPGGDLDWLAEEQVLVSGLDPARSTGETWAAAVTAARLRLLPKWNADRQRVIEAGGLAVLGAERLASRRLETRLRELAGQNGDTRFFMALDDGWLRAQMPDRIRRIFGQSDDPIGGRLMTWSSDRVQRKIERRIIAYHRRAFDYAAVCTPFREAIYAERCDLVEGPDPLGTLIALAGAGHEEGYRARMAEFGADALSALVRRSAQAVIDRKWAWYLRDLERQLRDLGDEGCPQESLPAYRRAAEARFEAMRRDMHERVIGHLLNPKWGEPGFEGTAARWYSQPADGAKDAWRQWPNAGSRVRPRLGE